MKPGVLIDAIPGEGGYDLAVCHVLGNDCVAASMGMPHRRLWQDGRSLGHEERNQCCYNPQARRNRQAGFGKATRIFRSVSCHEACLHVTFLSLRW